MKDGHLAIVHDFQDHKECFPNAFIVGGVMYFLWKSDKTTKGIKWFSHELDGKVIESTRDITSDSKIIRDFEADKLKNKILSQNTKTFDELVLERKPYGLCSSFRNFSKQKISGGIKLYYNEKAKLGIGYLPKTYKLSKGIDSLSKYKVLISKAIYTSFAGQSKYGLKPFISEPNSISTETYLVIKAKNKTEAENIITYMKTNFFYFLISIAKLSHNTSKKDFIFIPLLDFEQK
jgi:site-specific DNA-methyltransferase (adenine-specific)